MTNYSDWLGVGFALALVVVNFVGTWYLYGKRITDLEVYNNKQEAHRQQQDKDTQELKVAVDLLRQSVKNQGSDIEEIKTEAAKSSSAVYEVKITLAGFDERLKSIDSRSMHIEQVLTATISDVMKGLVKLQANDDPLRRS